MPYIFNSIMLQSDSVIYLGIHNSFSLLSKGYWIIGMVYFRILFYQHNSSRTCLTFSFLLLFDWISITFLYDNVHSLFIDMINSLTIYADGCASYWSRFSFIYLTMITSVWISSLNGGLLTIHNSNKILLSINLMSCLAICRPVRLDVIEWKHTRDR